MTQNGEVIYKQREWFSAQELTDIVNLLNDDEEFTYQEEVLAAISAIVISVNDSYIHPNEPIQYLLDCIVQILRREPVAHRHMQISKSALAKKPLIMQLLILMQDIVVRRQQERSRKQLLWLAISMYTGVLLMQHSTKTHSDNILMQFKQAQFSGSPRRTWIWRELPDFPQLTMDAECILSIFTTLLQLQQVTFASLNNDHVINVKELEKNKSELKAKLGQIDKITAAYQIAHYLKIKKPKKPPKIKTNNIKVEPISLADQRPFYQPNNEPTPHCWDTPRDDIENSSTSVDVSFLAADTEIYEGLTTSFEETVDHYDEPYISYEGLPKPLIKQSVPLQTIDLSLQQNYMSQRNLALSSNTRVLSLAGYQALFTALSRDAKSLPQLNHKICARILLLSMLTALPIKSLLTPGYIGHSHVFSIGTRRAYVKHNLGITKRSEKFNSAQHENKYDEIKIPIPLWLIEHLIGIDIPSNEDFITYLATLRTSLGLPCLSLNRVETALQVVLSRYTPNSHSHIADIICRTPAPHAPAIYYSSHSSEVLITHYKSALSVLNRMDSFDVSYITPWHKYTVGSGFALTPEYVREVIAKLKNWVNDSPDADVHFNRTSVFVWFVFCLLTGVRPNNGIGKTSDIDFELGWLIINDKPSKKVKNHRLVPLCLTLLKYLSDYKNYLINYQLNNPLKHEISISIDEIRLGDDIALLRLLSDSLDTLKTIKRGDAYHMTKGILDANPYWTRHFVRTQLEKNGVDLALINTIIGHEKARQEGLGRFSSLSKAKIKSVGEAFEYIVRMLELDDIHNNGLQHYTEVNHAH